MLFSNSGFCYKILLILSFCFLQIQSNAQKTTIKGKVIDSTTNIGVPWASIVIYNTQIGCETNKNGEFKLKVDKQYLDDSVKISSLNFQTKTLQVYQLLDENIKLNPKSYGLNTIAIESKKKRKKRKVELNPLIKYSDCFEILQFECKINLPYYGYNRKKFYEDKAGYIDREQIPFPQERWYNDEGSLIQFIPFSKDCDTSMILKEVNFYIIEDPMDRGIGHINDSIYDPKASCLKLHIFKPNINGIPDNKIQNIDDTIVISGAECATVKLEKYNITFPVTGLFVGLEIKKCKRHLMLITDNSDKNNTLDENYKNNWQLSNGGNRRQLKSNLAISLTVTDR